MRRRGLPTLYELARSHPGGEAAAPMASPFVSSAMRSLRIPLGFLWLLGVGVLVVAVIAYAFGYGRGKSAGWAAGLTQRVGQDTARATMQDVRDPLTSAPSLPSTAVVTTTSPRVEAARANVEPAAGNDPMSTQGSQGEPRLKGVNYFVIARPSDEGAEPMLAFCRAEGLDAHLVLDHNPKFRKIIVLPGLANSEARKSEDGQKLEARIKTAGQRWKAKTKGNRDFSDAYLELFR